MRQTKAFSFVLCIALLFLLSGCQKTAVNEITGNPSLSSTSSLQDTTSVSSADSSSTVSAVSKLELSEPEETEKKDVINIALFGIDSRNRGTTNLKYSISGRSDSIMILSVNKTDSTVKLTSVLRDSWVQMNSKGGALINDKINAAYAYGGARNAINCLNNNFGLDISEYVAVSMYQFWNVIDILGGIEIEVTEFERQKINYLGKLEGFNADTLESSGKVHLNGGQAMMYVRIRDDGDDNRALRQQKVLRILFSKFKQMSISEISAVLKELLPTVESSLDFDDIMELAPMLAVKDLKLQTTSVPGKQVKAKGGIFKDTKGAWVWKYDLDEAKTYINQWIYE